MSTTITPERRQRLRIDVFIVNLKYFTPFTPFTAPMVDSEKVDV